MLIENKSVIFLDEATANMDKDSSQKILSQLLRTAGLTVISIEHKVSPELLPLYDQILELLAKYVLCATLQHTKQVGIWQPSDTGKRHLPTPLLQSKIPPPLFAFADAGASGGYV